MKLRQSTPFLFGLAAFALVVCATGCLGSVTLYDVGRAPVDAVIADVNDDGRADIVVANAGSNDLTVRLQGPHGFFDETYTMRLPAGAAPSAITAGTFRKNGKPTIVVANRGGDSISLFDRFAAGATPTKTISLGPGADPAAVAVGDVDSDGDADLLVTTRTPTFPGCQTKGCVLVFRDKGDGLAYAYAAFPVGTDETVDYNPVSLAVGELWGGGRPEVAVVNRGTNEAVVIETTRDTFEKASGYTTADVKSPTTVQIGSVNGSRALVVASTASVGGRLLLATGRGIFKSPVSFSKLAGLYDGQLITLDPDTGKAGPSFDYTSPLLKGATRIVAGKLDPDSLVDGLAVRSGGNDVTILTSTQQWSSPAALDFGSVAVGATSQKKVTGKARVMDDWTYTPKLTGPDADSFRIEGCGTINPPGGSCSFTVTFAPSSPGVKHATVEIHDVNAVRTDNTAGIAWGRPTMTVTGTATGTGAGPRAGRLVTGVTDDYGKYSGDSGAMFFSTLRSLGMSENRMAVLWQSGQTTPSAPESVFLDRSIAEAQRQGIRIVLSVYPASPTQHDATQFCDFVRGVAQRYPYVKEIVVGNEPNKADFWSPVDPAAYTRLLARCYDQLHSLGVTVVGGALSARKLGKGASPVEFLGGMGTAYRASGRSAPVMDALSFHPYPNPERIARGVDAGYDWPNAGIPDLDRVKQAFEDAFAGTAQPTFTSTLHLKLDEIGWQAKIAAQQASLYTGSENSGSVDESQQAQYYAALVARAACDPLVSDLLLFHLIDEKELNASATSGGWQSGLLRADLSQRPSYGSVGSAIGAGCTGPMHSWAPATGVVGGSVTLTATAQQVRVGGKPQPGVKFSIGASAAEGVAWSLTIKNAAGKVVIKKNGTRNAPFDADAFIAPVLLGSGSYSATMTLIATTNGKRSLSTTKTGASQKK